MTTSDAPGSERGGKVDRAVWRIVLVVVLGTLMTALDSTTVNIALDTLSEELDAPLSEIQWLVSGFLLAAAAVVPLSGWMARRFGAKRMFLSTVGLYVLGSLLCGFSSSAPMLIVFRMLQGVGGGMLLPIGQMILVKAAGPRHLARVMGVWGAVVLLGPILGPIVGGVVLDTVSWRWIFFVNIPLGISAVVLGRRLLPADTHEDAGRFDGLGWAIVAVGLVGVIYGLAQLGSSADALTHVTVPLVGGVVLIAVFVVRAFRIERPLLDMRLYANKAFSASSANTFFVGGVVMVGTAILLPLYFQIVRREDPLDTALLLVPRGVAAAIAMLVSGRLTDRFGAGRTAVTGSLITLVGSIPFVFVQADTSYVVTSVVTSLQAFGLGLAGMPAMTAAFRTLRPAQLHDATPMQNIIHRLGGSIGAAVLAVVLQRQLAGAGVSASAQAAAFGTTFWWVLGATIVALAPTTYLLILERRHGFTLDATMPEAETAIVVPLEGA